MSTTGTTVLDPCPFCGGRAEFKAGVYTGYVMCLKCEVMGPNINQAEAEAAWNRRSPDHHIIARFLERTGQYVTNDATREAATKQAVDAAIRSLGQGAPFWVVWFEEAGRKPETFFGEGAEQAAREYFNSKRGSWSCHLLRAVADSTKPSSQTAVLLPIEFVKFLLGEGPLDGSWFGDDPAFKPDDIDAWKKHQRPRWWWRTNLRSLLP